MSPWTRTLVLVVLGDYRMPASGDHDGSGEEGTPAENL